MPAPSAPRIKALHLAYTLPLPPRSGYDLRVWHLCKNLARHMDITLLTRGMGDEADRSWSEGGVEIQVLRLPRPGPSLKALKGLRFLFSSWPVMSGGWHFQRMASRLKRLLAENRYDLIVLEGVWLSVYWPLIRKAQGLKVLNHYDLESESLGRQAEVLSGGFKKWMYRNAVRRMGRIEERMFREADLTWVTSEREQEVLRRRNAAWNIQVAPNGVDTGAIQAFPECTGRELLFVGSMNYFPNKDGVLYFVEEVLPLIRACHPEIVFRVVGRHPGPEIRALHQPGKVEITGEVESLTPYYQNAAVCVVPLRAGGGTRLKILEAMAYGRPVVSTTLGAEGLDIEPGRDYLLADDPVAFTKAVNAILGDASIAAGLAREARRLVEEKYAWSSIAGKMWETYKFQVSSFRFQVGGGVFQ
ncbi:MAG: glycosyltransferase family 4 protein [Lentisphaerota bacterium]